MVKKNCDDMLSRFHLTPERNGRTDGRTYLLYQYRRVSTLKRDKNRQIVSGHMVGLMSPSAAFVRHPLLEMFSVPALLWQAKGALNERTNEGVCRLLKDRGLLYCLTNDKKLSCRRETARYVVSLNTLPSH